MIRGLQSSDLDFQALYEYAPLAYQSLDGDGRILLVNHTWLDLLGYARDEVQGRHISEFLTPASCELLSERFPRFKACGLVRRAEFDLVHRSGEEIPVRLDGRVDRTPDGDFQRTHCLLADIREERAALQALARSELKYRRLVEMAQEGIWQVDQEARTVFVNPAMARMLGYTVAEMADRSLFDFMGPEAQRQARENFVRRAQGIAEQHDYIFRHRDGHEVVTTVEARPIQDESGNFAGALAGVMDTTERRRFEQELLHTQKLESLGVMAGGIAHDFNNLLQAILGNADLLGEEVDPGAPEAASIAAIRTAGLRAAELCRQMLAYAGQAALNQERVDLGGLVREMEVMLRASISKKANLELRIAEGLPELTADPIQLRQLVMNLVTNASEALGGEPGSIRVGLDPVTLSADEAASRFPGSGLTGGRQLRLEVADDGCGMDDAVRSTLFDPFFSTKFLGRGLGMAAVRGIIRGHRGAVAVDSEPGRGTVIEILLPVEAAAAAKPAAAADPAVATGSGPGTVLVADDEEAVLELVRRMLERLGHPTITARNGREAVEYFAARRDEIGLVLLDLTMPELDGAESLARIRSLDAAVPVGICSGYSADEVRLDLGQPDGVFFLQKPFDLSALRQALSRMQPRAADSGINDQ